MTDQEIIELFWQRLEDAIRCTAEKYGRYLTKIALNILNRFEEAEECVNDTYLAAWNQIPPTRPKKLLPYLGRITRYQALNRYDYLTAQKRNSEFDLQLSELEACLPSSDSFKSEYEAGEIASTISNFLRSIDADARNIFIRRYWFSDSIKDIATRFNMGESQIKSNLFRTRNRLKNHLEREDIAYGSK
jgi:RNA polymerase sigma-70 factor (ECF subfamily)